MNLKNRNMQPRHPLLFLVSLAVTISMVAAGFFNMDYCTATGYYCCGRIVDPDTLEKCISTLACGTVGAIAATCDIDACPKESVSHMPDQGIVRTLQVEKSMKNTTEKQINVGDPTATAICAAAAVACFNTGNLQTQLEACSGCAGSCGGNFLGNLAQLSVHGYTMYQAALVAATAGANPAVPITLGVCAITNGALIVACGIKAREVSGEIASQKPE